MQVQISELELRVWDEQAAGRRSIVDLEQQLAAATADSTRFQHRSNDLEALLCEANSSAQQRHTAQCSKTADLQYQLDQVWQVKAASSLRLQQWRNLSAQQADRTHTVVLHFFLCMWQWCVAAAAQLRDAAKATGQ